MDAVARGLQSAAAVVADLSQEVSVIAMREAGSVAPYFAACLALHVLFQYGLPALDPSIYDAIGRKKHGDNHAAIVKARGDLARGARMKIVAIIGSTVMCLGALYAVTLDPATLAVTKGMHPYASSPATEALMRLATGYFVWDVLVCALDREPLEYHLHGVSCLFVYLATLRPFAQPQFVFGLLFEASTPFLHLRTAMIQADAAKGPAFDFVQAAFFLLFLGVRIGMGYPRTYAMLTTVNALIADGSAHSIPMARTFQGLSVFLCALNAYWFYLMLARLLSGMNVTPKAPKDKFTAHLDGGLDSPTPGETRKGK